MDIDMATSLSMEPAFVDRPSSPVKIAAGKRLSVLLKYGICSILWLGVFLFAFIFTFVGAVIAAVPLVYCFGKWRRAIPSESYLAADCPHCRRSIVFWVRTAFQCPFCRVLLMKHEDRLFCIGKN